jgi:hypothetical protein
MPLAAAPRVEIRPLMRQVYMWMTLGLLVTAGVSLITTTIPAVASLVMNPVVLIIAFVAQIGLVIGLSAAFNRLSANAAAIMFMVYSGLTGFTLSVLLMFYSGTSIVAAFGTAAILFGTMTFIGLTTERDLTSMGTYLMMGVIGLIVASILNIFLQSSALVFIISLAGVVIFTGLTAYDTQKIKQMAMDPNIEAGGVELTTKLSILGALSLYLDFILLFQYLLMLFGGSRE